MAKALDVNENTARNQEHQTKNLGDKSKQRRLKGKSVQVNQNRLNEGDPIDSSAPQKECK